MTNPFENYLIPESNSIFSRYFNALIVQIKYENIAESVAEYFLQDNRLDTFECSGDQETFDFECQHFDPFIKILPDEELNFISDAMLSGFRYARSQRPDIQKWGILCALPPEYIASDNGNTRTARVGLTSITPEDFRQMLWESD